MTNAEKQVLVVVPCGSSKVWDRDPGHGPSLAKDAYAGAPFRVNRAYAERFGNAWVILSAKYGFILQDFTIPGPYEVTFKRPETEPVALDVLRQQIQALGLDRFSRIIGLGGKEYRAVLTRAFTGSAAELMFPFAGLPIGRAMQATNRAIASGAPIPDGSAVHG